MSSPFGQIIDTLQYWEHASSKARSGARLPFRHDGLVATSEEVPCADAPGHERPHGPRNYLQPLDDVAVAMIIANDGPALAPPPRATIEVLATTEHKDPSEATSRLRPSLPPIEPPNAFEIRFRHLLEAIR
jgi:hypothetical protein